uniref:YABBY N-terminal domain-containing protein n=1 Tax=Lactuca sativa TaxID=4236 RepID=A0A9R1V556_LACSA|nr:hypothetical protein LSAT_V11C700360020 [Lactuca sativa]
MVQVSVPCSSLYDTVTVRCGNCTNMWPVNVGMAAAFHQSLSAGSTSSFQDSSSSHHQVRGINVFSHMNSSLTRKLLGFFGGFGRFVSRVIVIAHSIVF